MGTFTAIGKQVSRAWTALVTTAFDGDTHLVVEGALNWSVGCEVVVTPTDLDPHEVCVCVNWKICICVWGYGGVRCAKSSLPGDIYMCVCIYIYII
jgi:hypothetical protein